MRVRASSTIREKRYELLIHPLRSESLNESLGVGPYFKERTAATAMILVNDPNLLFAHFRAMVNCE